LWAEAVPKKRKSLSRENTQKLFDYGRALRSATVSDDGVTIVTDWSNQNKVQTLYSYQFWYTFIMLVSSVTYGFFTKITFKAYGSQYHSLPSYMQELVGFAFPVSAFSRFFWPLVMDRIGFQKTYGTVLAIQIFLSFTMTMISPIGWLYKLYIGLSWGCEGGHFALFPPLSGLVYGPV